MISEKNPDATLESTYHDICNKLGKYEDICDDPNRLTSLVNTIKYYMGEDIESNNLREMLYNKMKEFGMI